MLCFIFPQLSQFQLGLFGVFLSMNYKKEQEQKGQV